MRNLCSTTWLVLGGVGAPATVDFVNYLIDDDSMSSNLAVAPEGGIEG